MKKFFIVLLIALPAFGQDQTPKLTPVIVKPGDCMNMSAGYTCYSDQDFKVLDKQQSRALQCEVELSKVKPRVVVKKVDAECPELPMVTQNKKKLWLKIGLGVLGGFALGLGVGLSQ